MIQAIVSGDKQRLGFHNPTYSVGTELQTMPWLKGQGIFLLRKYRYKGSEREVTRGQNER